MAVITRNVYDIFQPTPVSLKELSAITINLEIWRSQVIKLRTSGTSEDFDLLLPDLPSTIRNIIYEFRRRFSVSIDNWKRTHYERIFQFHRRSPNSVLNDFDGFVGDFDGSIHYVRTAEHMMRSDRLSEAEKFKIACTYFFEDDIRRIWPSVCESLDLNNFRFDKSPQVYYWICCLTNQLHKLSGRINERMLYYCMPYNRPSVEYFWARLPLESQLGNAYELYQREVVSFVRFILPKLDDQRLGEFVNTRGAGELMRHLLESGFSNEWLWIPTWMYIKNQINQNTVKDVVVVMLRHEGTAFKDHSKSEPNNWLDFCSAVWNSIPSDWKRSMVEDILSDIKFFEYLHIFSNTREHSRIDCGLWCRRFVTFLLIILSSATSEQRHGFWHICWPHLIRGTRGEDLHQMMKLCLENEDEIAQFIDNNMANSDQVRDVCVEILKVGHFNQLNDLIDFCYPETRKCMNFKQQLLRTTLYPERPQYGFCLPFFRILRPDFSGLNELSTFIDNAFGSVDLSADFKNELMSSRVIREKLNVHASWSPDTVDRFIEFVETFATSKRNLKAIKARVKYRLPPYLHNMITSPRRILLWCLGSEEKVTDFIQCYLRTRKH